MSDANRLNKLADQIEKYGMAEWDTSPVEDERDIVSALRFQAIAVQALKIIAGEKQCIDNLMSHAEVARAALDLAEGPCRPS